MTEKPHTEKTSAAGTIAGFDFQYYYFLYKLLTLKKGETVGFEALDDVHTQLDNDSQILIQVKHSIQSKADGSRINLTELDPDLWKTMHNWGLVITDKNDGRELLAKQKAFVKKTTFVLASNKSFTSTNTFLSNISKLQAGLIDFEDMTDYLRKLSLSTKSDNTRSYLASIVNLDSEILKDFLCNIRSELDVGNIVERCKVALEEKEVNPKEIDNLFNQLDSIVRQDIFKNFSSSKSLIYSFEEKKRKFRRYFDIANNPDLKIRKFEGTLPDMLEDQVFIKQLIDIEDVYNDEQEIIQNYTRYRLTFDTNLSDWVHEGQLTSEEIDIFKKEIFLMWETEFRAAYRKKNDPSEYPDIAHKVLQALRDKKIYMSEQLLLTNMTHGSLYSLSNKPMIGWLKGWEEVYK